MQNIMNNKLQEIIHDINEWGEKVFWKKAHKHSLDMVC